MVKISSIVLIFCVVRNSFQKSLINDPGLAKSEEIPEYLIARKYSDLNSDENALHKGVILEPKETSETGYLALLRDPGDKFKKKKKEEKKSKAKTTSAAIQIDDGSTKGPEKKGKRGR